MKPYINNWVNEYADFGLDMVNQRKKKEAETTEDPLHPLNITRIINSLKYKEFGVKHTRPNDFFGTLEWGRNDGALQLQFSPLGGLRAVIRRRVEDLDGKPTWICKKVIEVKNLFDKYPDSLSFLLEDVLKETDSKDVETPMHNWEGLQHLTIELANELRRKTTQVIFMYQGIRLVEHNRKYIIHFGCTGYGRQRVAGQKRLDQFDVNVEYNNTTGLIKIAGTELGDVIAQYRWIYDPSTFLEYFSPIQQEDEIVNAILTHFDSY